MFYKIKEKIGGYINRLFSFIKENRLKIKEGFKKEKLIKIKEKLFEKKDWTEYMSIAIIVFAIIMILVEAVNAKVEKKAFLEQQQQLQEQKETPEAEETLETEETPETEETQEAGNGGILVEYEELHNQNNDMIGWLKIEDTVIDYPVMQTMEDEQYYLKINFEKEDDKNGCLIMDTDSVVGEGTKELGYVEGTEPSSNLIIHGHNMKSGNMFGNLDLYEDELYGKAHNIIYFDSLY